jgi:hypothetical protein
MDLLQAYTHRMPLEQLPVYTVSLNTLILPVVFLQIQIYNKL